MYQFIVMYKLQEVEVRLVS